MSAVAQQAGFPGDTVIVVAVAGKLDAAAVPQVRTSLDEALAAQPAMIIVDLTGCVLIDAAGIALLLDGHRRAWMTDGRLTLRGPTPHVRRILEVARVAHIFPVEPEGHRPGADGSGVG